MDFDLNKLIYGDLLDPDILDKLGNVDLGIGQNDIMEDDDEQVKASPSPFQRKRSGEEKSEDRKSEDGDLTSNNNSPIEDDNQNDGVKSDKDSFQVEPEDEEENQEKRVTFKDIGESQANTQASQSKGIDLPILWRNERQGEIVYKLTELYRYTNQQQRQKSFQFVQNIIRTQNDDDCEYLKSREARNMRREIKLDLKNAREKIRHQIKFCTVPTNLIEEAMYRYRPMTSRELQRSKMGNKYENAPHIGRIIPTVKRAQTVQQPQTQEQVARLTQQQAEKEEQNKLKLYLQAPTEESHLIFKDPFEDQLNDQFRPTKKEIDELFGGSATTAPNTSSPNDHSMEDQLEAKQDAISDEKLLEARYIAIRDRMTAQELSLTDLTQQDRAVIKEYLKKMSSTLVESKYPSKVDGLNKVQKQAFTFFKNLNQANFAYKGSKSMHQSDLNHDIFQGGDEHDHFVRTNLLDPSDIMMDYDVPLRVQRINPIFAINDDEEEDSRPFVARNLFQSPPKHKEEKKEEEKTHNNVKIPSYNGSTDMQIQQWYVDQKCNLAGVKRQLYWGEPKDCHSVMQNNKDNYYYQQYLNQQLLLNQGKEEQIFTFEAGDQQPALPQLKQIPGKPPTKVLPVLPPTATAPRIPIKDQKEYEFLESQKAKFYRETNPFKDQPQISSIDAQTRNLNSILRRIAFVSGEITEEEFYMQEALEDQLEQQAISKANMMNTQKSTSKSSNLMKLMNNPNLADQLSEDYDKHFERTKKDRHDKLMMRIQQQEKQNQPSSTTTQTLAYASGKDIIHKAGSINDQHKKDTAQDAMDRKAGGYSDEDEDGEMPNENSVQLNQTTSATSSIHSKQNQQEGMTAEDDMKRVTKSRANELNHAKCILKLTYTKFEWSDHELLNFHRPNIQEVFERQSAINNGEIAKINTKVLTNEYIEKKSKKIGINAHEYFKDRFKLSLKDGKFCLFEHVDQRPLFVNNFGMASKLKRYVYSDQPLPQSAFTRRSENKDLRHMGPYGVQVMKKRGEKIPLLGQIDNQRKGITVLENNMYYCPVFYHKAHKNDFLCIMHQDKYGKNQIFVRELQEVYLMGQIEPKTNMEVYNPQSRTYQHFIKRRTQAYVIRFLQENENHINFSELNKFFSYINDQILKKIIKEINVEVDRNQSCFLPQECKDEQFRQLITPENICQYESAQFGEMMLKKVGIREITNADKISYATNKFCSEETDLRKQLIARIIEEEVLSTPWNLSQNFNHNRQQRGMMMLEGIGDPSNGHGGYSYLKLPLKISQDSLNKAKINRMYLNPAIQNPKAVTGTDADLRKLSKQDIHQKLVNLGYKKETIEQYSRWEMVALLRDRSSLAVTQGAEGEMKKFARGVRFTSKKQREMYQKQVNEIFKKQINYLQMENIEGLSDMSDGESKDQRQKKFKEMQQINSNNSKSIVELKQDIEVKKIQDIPGFEILLMNSLAQKAAPGAAGAGPNQPGITGLLHGGAGGQFQCFDDREAAKKALREKMANDNQITFKCEILRKKIKAVNQSPEQQQINNKIERVIFCSDQRQVKGFKKRKHKHEVKTKRTKKTSLKEKMQTSKPFMETLNNAKRESETQSFTRQAQGRNNLRDSGNPPSISGSSMPRLSTSPVKIKLGQIQQNPIQQSKTDTFKLGQKVISIPTQLAQTSYPMNYSNQMPSQGFQLDQGQVNLAMSQMLSTMGGSSIQDFSRPQPGVIRLQPSLSTQSGSIKIGLGNIDTQRQQAQKTQLLPAQQQQKISISIGSGASNQSQMQQRSYYQEEEKKMPASTFAAPLSRSQSKTKPSQTAPQLKPQASAPSSRRAVDLADEDYENNLYKPRHAQPTRRRQQSEESALNEIFENIVDSCIKNDKSRIFSQAVKRKDAPNYYDVIKNPIDLTQIKNKAKRIEYFTKDQLLADFKLLVDNAMIFNGQTSDIAKFAYQIYSHAIEKLNEVGQDVENLQMLVGEKIEKGFLRTTPTL